MGLCSGLDFFSQSSVHLKSVPCGTFVFHTSCCLPTKDGPENAPRPCNHGPCTGFFDGPAASTFWLLSLAPKFQSKVPKHDLHAQFISAGFLFIYFPMKWMFKCTSAVFIRPEWRFDIPRIQKSLQKYLGKGKNGGTESTTDGILGEVNNFNGLAKLIAKANNPTGIPLKQGC